MVLLASTQFLPYLFFLLLQVLVDYVSLCCFFFLLYIPRNQDVGFSQPVLTRDVGKRLCHGQLQRPNEVQGGTTKMEGRHQKDCGEKLAADSTKPAEMEKRKRSTSRHGWPQFEEGVEVDRIKTQYLITQILY